MPLRVLIASVMAFACTSLAQQAPISLADAVRAGPIPLSAVRLHRHGPRRRPQPRSPDQGLRRDAPAQRTMLPTPAPSSASAPSPRSSPPTCSPGSSPTAKSRSTTPSSTTPHAANASPQRSTADSITLLNLATHTAGLPAKSAPIRAKTPHFTFPDLRITLGLAAATESPLHPRRRRPLFQHRLRPARRRPRLRLRQILRPAPPRPPAPATQHVGYHPRPLRRAMRPPAAGHQGPGPLHRHPGLRPQRRPLFNPRRHGQIPPVPAANSRLARPARLSPRRLPQPRTDSNPCRASATPAIPPASASPGFNSATPPPPPPSCEKTGGGAGFTTYIALSPSRNTGVFLAATWGKGDVHDRSSSTKPTTCSPPSPMSPRSRPESAKPLAASAPQTPSTSPQSPSEAALLRLAVSAGCPIHFAHSAKWVGSHNT